VQCGRSSYFGGNCCPLSLALLATFFLLVNLLAYNLAQTKKTAIFSETSLNYQPTKYYIAEDNNLLSRRCENLKHNLLQESGTSVFMQSFIFIPLLYYSVA
jgi:hypothetical protein